MAATIVLLVLSYKVLKRDRIYSHSVQLYAMLASYAVAELRAGDSIKGVQDTLGHYSRIHYAGGGESIAEKRILQARYSLYAVENAYNLQRSLDKISTLLKSQFAKLSVSLAILK